MEYVRCVQLANLLNLQHKSQICYQDSWLLLALEVLKASAYLLGLECSRRQTPFGHYCLEYGLWYGPFVGFVSLLPQQQLVSRASRRDLCEARKWRGAGLLALLQKLLFSVSRWPPLL